MNSVQIRRLRNSALAATLLLTCVLSNSGGSPDTFSQARTTPALSNRLIIKFKDGATTTSGTFDFRAAASQLDGLGTRAKQPGTGVVGLRHLKSITSQTHVALTAQPMPRAELFALAKRLEQDPAVAYAEIDEIAYPQMVPNDTQYAANQWHYMAPATFAGGANLPLAWDSATGAGVVVAVIDTGYRPHADLAANILPGYDFISSFGAGPSASTVDSNDGDGRDADASDPGDWNTTGACGGAAASSSSWHGTHVAGTVAAVTNNNLGVAGVAFNAKVLPVRVLGVCGGFVSDIAAGMLWAVGQNVPGVPNNPAANNAKVLNLSLGGTATCPATFQAAVDAVRAAGSVVVVATGNDSSTTTIGTPANCNGVIAVTANTKLGDSAYYANIGTGTMISAPGGSTGRNGLMGDGGFVTSTLNSGTTTPGVDAYAGYAGTSMATPHVAGVAALLASLQPTITPDTLASVLSNSARDFPAGTYCFGRSTCGSGLLDAKAAIDRLNSLLPVSAASTPAALWLTGSTVPLNGQVTVAAGGDATLTYQWTQLTGPAVTLSGANTASASFAGTGPGASYSFKFKVIDGSGLSSSSQVSVSTDTLPVLGAISAKSVVTGSNLSFTVTATDAENDAVVFVVSGLPAGATFAASTGVFNWNNAGPAGNYSVTITPNDGKLNGNAQSVCVSVNATGAAGSCSVASGGGGGGALTLLDLVGLLLSLCAGLWLSLRRTPKK